MARVAAGQARASISALRVAMVAAPRRARRYLCRQEPFRALFHAQRHADSFHLPPIARRRCSRAMARRRACHAREPRERKSTIAEAAAFSGG